MTEVDIMQITISGRRIGISGLKRVMETMAQDLALLPDEGNCEEIGAEMINRLSGDNYIPRQVRDLYAVALVREFKRYLGQPVPEEPLEGLRIVILGPGCARCSQMEADVREVMAEMELAGELSHMDDLREIARYGVLGVPVLVINDRVVCAGQVPHRSQIKTWLTEETSSAGKE
jgi:small redox-active disulfide protein 2